MQLSKNFKLIEFTKSSTAKRLGINNEPSKEVIKNLEDICYVILEPCRAFFQKPIYINSGFRSLSLNRVLKSSDKSQHTTGNAVDIEIKDISNMKLACWLKDNVDFDQLILEFYNEDDPNSGWVHISHVSEEDNRKEILTFDGKKYSNGIENMKIKDNKVIDLSK